MRFKRICVFCGSSSGNKTVYLDVARELGNELVSRQLLGHLVFGVVATSLDCSSCCRMVSSAAAWMTHFAT